MDEKDRTLIDLARKKRYIFLVEKMGRGETLTSKELKELENLSKYFEKSEDKPIVLEGTVDLPTLAVYLEKSHRMIRRYVKQGMPVIRDADGEISKFKVSEVFKWYYSGKGTDEEGGREYWDIEYKKSRAKLNDLFLKEKKKEIIPFAEHVSIVKNQIRGIKSGFLRLPKYIAPKLSQQDPKVICEILDKEIRSIINQFAKRKQNEVKDSQVSA